MEKNYNLPNNAETFWNTTRYKLLPVMVEISSECQLAQCIPQWVKNQIHSQLAICKHMSYSFMQNAIKTLFPAEKQQEFKETVEKIDKIIQSINENDMRFIMECIDNQDAVGLEQYFLLENPKLLFDIASEFDFRSDLKMMLKKKNISYNADKLGELDDVIDLSHKESAHYKELVSRLDKLEQDNIEMRKTIIALDLERAKLFQETQKSRNNLGFLEFLRKDNQGIPTANDINVQNLYHRISYHHLIGKASEYKTHCWIDLYDGEIYDLTEYTRVKLEKSGKSKYFIHNEYKRDLILTLQRKDMERFVEIANHLEVTAVQLMKNVITADLNAEQVLG